MNFDPSDRRSNPLRGGFEARVPLQTQTTGNARGGAVAVSSSSTVAIHTVALPTLTSLPPRSASQSVLVYRDLPAAVNPQGVNPRDVVAHVVSNSDGGVNISLNNNGRRA